MTFRFTGFAIALILSTSGGCFSRQEVGSELIAKPGESREPAPLAPGQFVYRIFGSVAPFIALYHPEDGTLVHIYKVRISDRGGDFWSLLREDSRVTRETRYYAVSGTINPATFPREGEAGGGSFRADIFRGSPSKLSRIGKNTLVKIQSPVFVKNQRTGDTEHLTHLFMEESGSYHAIPMKAESDLISFSIVEGLSPDQLRRPWLNTRLSPQDVRPGNSAMGCTGNYSGLVLDGQKNEESPITTVCEKQGRAGAD